MRSLPALILLLQVQLQLPGAISTDSAEALRDLARKAEREYEFLMRSMAPSRFGSSVSRGECDEIVGRFCLRYEGDETSRPDSVEPGKVISARQLAVERLRMAFAALPHELTTAGPLLRYLVEDDRAEEAVAAARTFAWASRDSVWGPLLEGYALHAAGDDSLAERRFDDGLARLPEDERRKLERISDLVDHGERRLYDDLPAEERAMYEEALWRLADPLYLTVGNERRAEHIARHVWSRLLAEAPIVRWTLRWGDDLEQLTVRYGVPTSRERLRGWSIMAEETMVEYYDPEQLAYLPEALRTAGFPETPPPGDPWPLDNERARSGYAPRTLRKLRPISHQVSRFPAGDSILLRIDGALALDSVAGGGSAVDAGLFILDRAYRPGRAVLEAASVVDDTARVSFEVFVPADTVVYSLELLERETRFAGRARYRLSPRPPGAGGLVVSDPVVVEPFGTDLLPANRGSPRFRPRTNLVLATEDTIGLYLEAHHLSPATGGTTRYRVELVVEPVDDPSFIARAVGWIGRTLGISGPDVTPTLSWEGEGRVGRAEVLAVDLPLRDLKPGLHTIQVTVTDLAVDEADRTRRLIRIREN